MATRDSRGERLIGKATVGQLTVGGGGAIKKIASGTITLDPANVSANASLESAVTITGVAVGDIVIFEPPVSLETGLVPCATGRVSGADTVQLRLTNATASGIDGASRTWRYVWFDLT